MRIYLSVKFFLLLLIICNVAFSSSGKQVRVISLMPSITEMICDLSKDCLNNSKFKIVGTVEHSNAYSQIKDAVKNKVVLEVGPYYKISIEKVIALDSDVIFASHEGNSKEQIEKLIRLKRNVIFVNPKIVNEISGGYKVISSSLQLIKEYEQIDKQFNQLVSKLKILPKLCDECTVLIQVGYNPIFVSSNNTFLSDALEQIGLKNIFEGEGYFKPTMESILKLNPEFILIFTLGDSSQQWQEAQKYWFQFKHIKAVKNKKVLLIKDSAIVRPTLGLFPALFSVHSTLNGLN